MKKLILLGMMLSWGAAAQAQNGSSSDQCAVSALPVVGQTDVATLQRGDNSSAVIQLDVTASRSDGPTLAYAFSSPDGTITGDGPRATWTVSGDGPFSADVAVSAPDGCTSHAHFTYHMEQTTPQDAAPSE